MLTLAVDESGCQSGRFYVLFCSVYDVSSLDEGMHRE
jgi:hypothetical protein